MCALSWRIIDLTCLRNRKYDKSFEKIDAQGNHVKHADKIKSSSFIFTISTQIKNTNRSVKAERTEKYFS